MNTERLKEVLAQARHETGKVIIGQHDVIDKALIAIFTGSHALIEGVPGVAKTLLVRTLAHVLGADFARIQFTPDLMPADITGTNVFNLQRNEFSSHQGPDLHLVSARGRNQPRAGQDAIRPVAGDAGALGDDRPRNPRAAAELHRLRHAKSD